MPQKHGSNLRTHLILLKGNFVAVREVLVEILPPTQSAVKRKEISLTVGGRTKSFETRLSEFPFIHLKLFFVSEKKSFFLSFHRNFSEGKKNRT